MKTKQQLFEEVLREDSFTPKPGVQDLNINSFGELINIIKGVQTFCHDKGYSATISEDSQVSMYYTVNSFNSQIQYYCSEQFDDVEIAENIDDLCQRIFDNMTCGFDEEDFASFGFSNLEELLSQQYQSDSGVHGKATFGCRVAIY
jgi:hypothetical protein